LGTGFAGSAIGCNSESRAWRGSLIMNLVGWILIGELLGAT